MAGRFLRPAGVSTASGLALMLASAGCAPKPARPAADHPGQAREIERCDDLYSRCLGRPSGIPPAPGSVYGDEWRGELVADCNRRLKRCYEEASRSREPAR